MNVAERIQLAYRGVEMSDPMMEQLWHGVTERIAAESRGVAPVAVARRHRRITRVAILAAVVVVALAGYAGARSGLFHKLFGSDTPPTQRMKVFQQPAVTPTPSAVFDDDTPRVSSALQRELEPLWRRESQFMDRAFGDRAPLDRARVLLSFSDEIGTLKIYALPTANGNVCFVTVGAFEATNCAGPFALDNPVYPFFGFVGGVYNVRGLAADEVVAVDVELVDGTRQPAVMGANAFGWLGTTASSGLVVTYASGTSKRIAAPQQPPTATRP